VSEPVKPPRPQAWWEGTGGVLLMGAWLFVSLVGGIAIGAYLSLGLLGQAAISFVIMAVLALVGYRVLGVGRFER
jgi:hypothetical protein